MQGQVLWKNDFFDRIQEQTSIIQISDTLSDQPSFEANFTPFRKDIMRRNISGKAEASHLSIISMASNMGKHTDVQYISECTPSQKRRKQDRKALYDRTSKNVRQMSESNRMRSQEKIKNEEICYHLKIKMTGILRQLQLKNQDIQSLQSSPTQDFIFSFFHILLNHLKKTHKISQYMSNQIIYHEKTSKEQSEELGFWKNLFIEKQAEWKNQKQRLMANIKDLGRGFSAKKDEFTYQIIQKQVLSAQKCPSNSNLAQLGQHICKPSLNNLDQQQKNQRAKRRSTINSQEEAQKKLEQDKNLLKFERMIRDWKNELVKTVDYYENILEQKQKNMQQMRMRMEMEMEKQKNGRYFMHTQSM